MSLAKEFQTIEIENDLRRLIFSSNQNPEAVSWLSTTHNSIKAWGRDRGSKTLPCAHSRGEQHAKISNMVFQGRKTEQAAGSGSS